MADVLRVGVEASSLWNEHGVGRFTRELCAALLKRRSEFRYTLVVDRLPEPTENSLSPPGAEFIVATDSQRRGELSRRPRFGLWMARLASKANFDLIYYPTADTFLPVFPGTPTVVTFHDTVPERFPALAYPTRRDGLSVRVHRALAKTMARRIMAVSEATARDLVDTAGIDRRRIDRVSEAADGAFCVVSDQALVRAARSAQHIPHAAPLLTFVGGVEPTKNLLGLLRALPAVLRAVPGVHLAVVGDAFGGRFPGQRALVIEAVKKLGLSAHVHFTGYLSDADLVALLNGSTALVCPSLWEGFGLPAVEAMACGVPVLASARGSLPEVVGDAGLYFDPFSEADIAATIVRLLGDDGLRTYLAREARERAESFTWDHGAALAEACFRNALM